jgi:hypothetical protein
LRWLLTRRLQVSLSSAGGCGFDEEDEGEGKLVLRLFPILSNQIQDENSISNRQYQQIFSTIQNRKKKSKLSLVFQDKFSFQDTLAKTK